MATTKKYTKKELKDIDKKVLYELAISSFGYPPKQKPKKPAHELDQGWRGGLPLGPCCRASGIAPHGLPNGWSWHLLAHRGEYNHAERVRVRVRVSPGSVPMRMARICASRLSWS